MVDEDFTAPQSAAAVRVLLVDDDPVFAARARTALEQAGPAPCSVLHARTLSEADTLLASGRVSVILLSLQLRQADPTAWLRANRARLSAAVIALTRGETNGDESLFVAGAQDVLVTATIDDRQLARSVRYAADRERVRQQLLRGREYFQSLIEQARDLITVVDERGTVVYQSPASTHLLGAAPETFVERSFFGLVAPDEQGAAAQMLTSVFAGIDQKPGGEFHIRHADGAFRIFDVVASLIPPVAGQRRAVLNSRDVTERRQTEEAFRQGQKMEAVGRLAGGIAHDFSNVLTVITGACENLLDAAHENRVAAPGLIETILRNCGRASSLTRQLLAFSRQQTLAPRPLDLESLVSRTAQLLTQLIGEHIRLSVDVAPGLKAIEADPVQIEQVLMNLAINARDAMPSGGALRIVLDNVEVDEAFAHTHLPMVPGSYVLVQVSDTGHGMDVATKARAFEPFFTTKDPVQGTGLGLSTVYGIIKQSGGFIYIDSEPGQGATFRIYLNPVDAVPCEPPVPKRRPAGPVRPATILLTEDEPDVRGLLRDMLASSGYTVVEATDPADALRRSAALDGRIDLLLTDVVMPGSTGRSLARALTAMQPDLKVLYMSGYPEHGAAPGSVLEPGVPFLAKPFTRELLLEQVQALLG